MSTSYLPIWIVDVGGSVLMIVFSFMCLHYAVRLRRRDAQNIVWAYLLWVCIALALFAVSRSVGHILRQLLIVSGHAEWWEPIQPYSGAINTFAFVMVAAVTLFFARTWTLYQNIIQGRQALQVAHGELLYLNQNLENLVAERTEALAQSEHKYRRIFEGSKDMILVTRKEGTILDINAAGKLMLAWEPSAAPDGQRSFQDYFWDSGQWSKIAVVILRQGFIANTEVELKIPGGEGRRRVLLSGGLAEGPSEEEGAFHFLVKDIEQQHLMREQMAQADKLASIGELSSGIAHEINNPLGIILGYTQLMLRNEPKGSDREADLKTIEKQVRYCKSIVEDLLNFARTSTPKKELHDVHAVIDDVLHFIRQHAKLDGIDIRTSYDRRIGPLLIDEKKISQVLINLLMNAIYAVGREGGITVATEVNGSNQRAYIRVQDTGHGIQSKDMARIFDPFFTTKPTGQGTGLGLSVSYGIIKNHGGSIRVESTPGQGATFTIELPMPAASNGR